MASKSKSFKFLPIMLVLRPPGKFGDIQDIREVRVLEDYQATQPGHVSVKKDEKIYVLEVKDQDPNWRLTSGEFGRKIGLLPASFIETKTKTKEEGKSTNEIPKDKGVKDEHGNTPLHLACIEGRLDKAKTLLENSADPFIVNSDGKMPIDLCQDIQLKAFLGMYMSNQNQDSK